MKRKFFIVVGALVVMGACAAATGGALYYTYPVQMATLAGLTRNYIISLAVPAGAATTESNAAYGAAEVAPAAPADAPPDACAGDWPSYNKTLTSERYSPLSQINTKNVGKLKVLCTYDTNQFAAFESGLIMVDGALIGTTEFDIFSINPATRGMNWASGIRWTCSPIWKARQESLQWNDAPSLAVDDCDPRSYWASIAFMSQ